MFFCIHMDPQNDQNLFKNQFFCGLEACPFSTSILDPPGPPKTLQNPPKIAPKSPRGGLRCSWGPVQYDCNPPEAHFWPSNRRLGAPFCPPTAVLERQKPVFVQQLHLLFRLKPIFVKFLSNIGKFGSKNADFVQRLSVSVKVWSENWCLRLGADGCRAAI